MLLMHGFPALIESTISSTVFYSTSILCMLLLASYLMDTTTTTISKSGNIGTTDIPCNGFTSDQQNDHHSKRNIDHCSETGAADLLKRLRIGVSVPDEELRDIVRTQLKKRLSWGTKTTHEQQLSFDLDFIKSLKETEVTREEQDLYDLPSSFLNMIYGATLKESCSYFKDESMSLDEAEVAAHDLYCERAQIRDGQSVLDIGCGQGSFVFHVAHKFKNCHVTAVTNSNAQKIILEKRCSTLELSNVEIILGDVSKLEMESTFDRILLIESLEHMKNYKSLLNKISKWMKDDGLLFVDYLCHKVFGHNFQKIDEEDDVFSGYLFPDGITIQSPYILLYFQDNVTVLDHWIISGKHMARTMEELLKNLDKNIEGAKDVLENKFKSKEAASQMITYWRTFFIAWNEQFNYNNGDEWMISQILFNKNKKKNKNY